jgi:hypothetical protein
MDSTIINGIFTLLGVILGGAVSYFTSKDEKERNALNRQINELSARNASLQKDIIRLCNQVASYWHIEKAYSDEVATLTHKKSGGVLKARRDRIEKRGYERPIMTENDTREIVNKL